MVCSFFLRSYSKSCLIIDSLSLMPTNTSYLLPVSSFLEYVIRPMQLKHLSSAPSPTFISMYNQLPGNRKSEHKTKTIYIINISIHPPHILNPRNVYSIAYFYVPRCPILPCLFSRSFSYHRYPHTDIQTRLYSLPPSLS